MGPALARTGASAVAQSATLVATVPSKPTTASGAPYTSLMHCLSCLPNGWARRTVALALLITAQRLGAQAPARSTDTLRLSLDQAVAMGIRQSDEIGLANAQIDVADAQFASARANALPQLRFTGQYTHVY